MSIKEIQSKSILIRRPKVDSWFLAGYGMNLYRGCSHRCVYCDGQAESYRVEGVFGEDVAVKVNALELLRKELDPTHHRKPFKKGLILVGGGVGDSYQPCEKTFELTRGALKLIAEFGHPVHLLTKSTLVLRDIDLLTQINRQSRAVVSFSFSSVDRELCHRFEPGASEPEQRLAAIRQLKRAGLTCGIFLMPVIPYISDSDRQITEDLKQAKAADVDFVVFGGMTLKAGQQKDYFMQTLKQHSPELERSYDKLYPGDRWGAANEKYYLDLYPRFYRLAKSEGIPIRMPISLCQGFIELNDLVVLFLEQLDYLLKLQNKKSSLGYVAYQLSKIKVDLRQFTDFGSIQGMKPEIEGTIREICQTGGCRQYQDLMNFRGEKDGN